MSNQPFSPPNLDVIADRLYSETADCTNIPPDELMKGMTFKNMNVGKPTLAFILSETLDSLHTRLNVPALLNDPATAREIMHSNIPQLAGRLHRLLVQYARQ